MENQSAKPQIHAHSLMPLWLGFLFVCCLAAGLQAQQSTALSTQDKRAVRQYQRAEQAYLKGDYERAQRWLERSLSRDASFVEAWLLLGDVFGEKGDMDRSRQSFKQAIEIDPYFYTPAHYFVAGLAMEAQNYAEALQYAEQFLSMATAYRDMQLRALKIRDRARFAMEAIENPFPFEPVNLGEAINTETDEYINAIRLDDSLLFFTRRYKPADFDAHGRYNENFFVSRRSAQGWDTARQMITDWPFTHNIGAISISADGRTMFVTACGWPDGFGSCDIYVSGLENGYWSQPRNLGGHINTARWESQPSVSANGSELYFASQRRGGYGGSDLWMSHRQSDGSWSRPVNLGDNINTAGNEMAPFIHPDGQTLYFSSNGHIGLGGSDLFMSRRDTSGQWQPPVNLGYPINTSEDEINIIINTAGDKAYMSARREEGYGGFDIYVFDLPEAFRPVSVSWLHAFVSDKRSAKPLEADYSLIDLAASETVQSGRSVLPEGSFLACLPAGKDYALHIHKPGYLFYSEHFRLMDAEKSRPFVIRAELQPIEEGSVTVLRNVFFDTDEARLKPESYSELKRLSVFLANNPGLTVELAGHTDSTGHESYNVSLSLQRAESVREFLLEQAISEWQISVRGYGSAQPIADNRTEEGRALNRRTEMRITGLGE